MSLSYKNKIQRPLHQLPICLPQRAFTGCHRSLPIPRHRCETIRLRAAKPLPLIINNLHPYAEYWPSPSTDSLHLSFQHVHQQRVATNGDANFLRQPVHELLCPERFLKSCFALFWSLFGCFSLLFQFVFDITSCRCPNSIFNVLGKRFS